MDRFSLCKKRLKKFDLWIIKCTRSAPMSGHLLGRYDLLLHCARWTLPECYLQFWHVGKINGIETAVAILQVKERNDSRVSLRSRHILSCFQLVAFPFSVWYLVVAHFLRDAVRSVRVLDRRRWVVVFLLRGISVIVKIREQEVEEHRVWQNKD